MSDPQTKDVGLASTLRQLAKARFAAGEMVTDRFFAEEAEAIARACLAMARRFEQGGRLLAFGAGNAVTDAQHVAVEFVHPVIVGKRALPALALGSDVAATIGLATSAGWKWVYERQLTAVGRSEDIALAIDPLGDDAGVAAALAAARRQGMLTLYLRGGAGDRPIDASADFTFHVPSDDAPIVQETHETLYHVLWELVHVFFEHQALLHDEAG